MPEYAWLWLYKQDSEYGSGPKYSKILNMAEFCRWNFSQYVSVTQLSRMLEYALTGFWLYLVF